MQPTTLFRIIDALIAKFTADVDATVLDGPAVTGEVLGTALIVGWDPADENGRAGNIGQDYRNLGTEASRDDTGSVVCCAWAQSGDATHAVLRARVEAVLVDVQDVLRTDPTLGLPGVLWCDVAGAELYQGNDDGNAVRLPFRIAFTSIV